MTTDFIIQNNEQQNLLKKNYKKNNPLLIPNIWDKKQRRSKTDVEKNSILWVSNFKQLKRPLWFIDIAKKKPEYNFVMVGNPIDKDLFEKCKIKSSSIKNLKFLGGLTFNETNKLFEKARIFICTSEIEGFPNTFLQAWTNECPVISSFDPSDIIKENNLGMFVEDIESMINAIDSLYDGAYFNIVQEKIRKYFDKTHNPQYHYQRLIDRFIS